MEAAAELDEDGNPIDEDAEETAGDISPLPDASDVPSPAANE